MRPHGMAEDGLDWSSGSELSQAAWHAFKYQRVGDGEVFTFSAIL